MQCNALAAHRPIVPGRAISSLVWAVRVLVRSAIQQSLRHFEQSHDGGFGFQTPGDWSPTDSKARAYRADLSVGLGDFFKGSDGVFTFYKQSMSAGYSAPGQMTLKDTEQYGGTLKMPVTNRLSLAAKGDQRIEEQVSKPGRSNWTSPTS